MPLNHRFPHTYEEKQLFHHLKHIFMNKIKIFPTRCFFVDGNNRKSLETTLNTYQSVASQISPETLSTSLD
jgi:predicted TIM-barrel enzyme